MIPSCWLGLKPYNLVGTPLHSQKLDPGGCPYVDLPLLWAPFGWPDRSPKTCHNPLDMNKVPIIFWSPIYGLGAAKKKVGCFATRYWRSLRCATVLFYFSLWPWSWWVPGSRSVKDPHHNRLKFRVQATERGWLRAGGYRSEKILFFCEGEVFFLDTCLLMGANSRKIRRVIIPEISFRNIALWNQLLSKIFQMPHRNMLCWGI